MYIDRWCICESEGNASVEYLSDGGYIITEITESLTRAAKAKAKDVTKTKYDSNGNLEWRILFTAIFTYDGVTASCTGVDLDVEIYDNAWYKIYATKHYGAASAWAEVQMGRKVLGVTVEKPEYILSLNCDPNGNIY